MWHTRSSRHGCAFIALGGNITCGNAPEVRTIVIRAPGPGDREVVLDLERLQGLDPAGAEALGAAVDELRARGVDVSIAGAPPEVQERLRWTRLAALLPGRRA